MCFQGKKVLWIAHNPFRESISCHIWGLNRPPDLCPSGILSSLSGQIQALLPCRDPVWYAYVNPIKKKLLFLINLSYDPSLTHIKLGEEVLIQLWVHCALALAP